MRERIRRLFRYDRWANGEALGSARGRQAALRLMAHVLGAEWLWLSRLRGLRPPVPVWPEWNELECERQRAALRPEWEAYLAALTDEDLKGAVDYVNSKGERWRSTVEDVLMHVVLHSAYHRGQAATAVRASGAEPAYTDFIHAVRRGFVD